MLKSWKPWSYHCKQLGTVVRAVGILLSKAGDRVLSLPINCCHLAPSGRLPMPVGLATQSEVQVEDCGPEVQETLLKTKVHPQYTGLVYSQRETAQLALHSIIQMWCKSLESLYWNPLRPPLMSPCKMLKLNMSFQRLSLFTERVREIYSLVISLPCMHWWPYDTRVTLQFSAPPNFVIYLSFHDVPCGSF